MACYARAKSPEPFWSESVIIGIANAVVRAKLDVPLVSRMGKEVVFVRARRERTEHVGLHLECTAHPSKLEVPEPELCPAESNFDPRSLEDLSRAIHRHPGGPSERERLSRRSNHATAVNSTEHVASCHPSLPKMAPCYLGATENTARSRRYLPCRDGHRSATLKPDETVARGTRRAGARDRDNFFSKPELGRVAHRCLTVSVIGRRAICSGTRINLFLADAGAPGRERRAETLDLLAGPPNLPHGRSQLHLRGRSFRERRQNMQVSWGPLMGP
jgi:hypothetical protein